jgi:hypothetical protein
VPLPQTTVSQTSGIGGLTGQITEDARFLAR